MTLGSGGRIHARLVDQQVRDWVRREELRKGAPGTSGDVAPLPVITVSRDRGSLGGRVGYLVSRELGFQLIDKEFVEYIAESVDMRHEIVERMDETIRHRMLGWLEEFQQSHNLTRDLYFKHLVTVMAGITQRGGAVIVGRGGNFIIGPASSLRVRIVCPIHKRILEVAESEHMEMKAAEHEVHTVDKVRRKFVQTWFKKEIADPEGYDLTINTDEIAPEDAAQLICEAYRRRFHLSAADIAARLEVTRKK